MRRSRTSPGNQHGERIERHRVRPDSSRSVSSLGRFLKSEEQMSRRPQLALVALPLAVCPPVAIAQAPSPPGVHERELAQIIRQAGYDCREVERIEVRASPDPAFDSLRPEVAICKNGKKFLVTRSGRGGANARPIVRP